MGNRKCPRCGKKGLFTKRRKKVKKGRVTDVSIIKCEYCNFWDVKS